MIIDLVVGARPNFVKAAAIINAAKSYPSVKINLIHTGQHTDLMSDPFFKELELPTPKPHQLLKFGEGPREPIDRLGMMMSHCAAAFRTDKPDYVMVVGDTDSTAAGAISAAKMKLPLIHVEAGLRCGNMGMQEEINRVLVDSVSDILYTTTGDARDRLIAEGHSPLCTSFVGNVMVDTLYRFLPKARQRGPWGLETKIGRNFFLQPYAVLTLHRAENLNNDTTWRLMGAASSVAKMIPVVFPVHPRTRSFIGGRKLGNVRMIDPMSYLDFIGLVDGASFVMTDSGGLQEETTALGIPCITLRNETERPETVTHGSNVVVGTDSLEIFNAAYRAIRFKQRLHTALPERVPALWDGHAADRILADLVGGTSN
jgi:UDP-N-acetylglucosamine 2-epimerase (non-hydrolysing)